MSDHTESEDRARPQDRWGHTDASWLMDRTGLFGWPRGEKKWLTLLSLLEKDAWIEFGSTEIRADGLSLSGTPEYRSMLAAGAGAGWIDCWHRFGSEDVEMGLTSEGRIVLARLLQAHLDDLRDRAAEIDGSDDAVNIADEERRDKHDSR